MQTDAVRAIPLADSGTVKIAAPDRVEFIRRVFAHGQVVPIVRAYAIEPTPQSEQLVGREFTYRGAQMLGELPGLFFGE